VSGGDCVVYVEPGDESAFADELVKLLDDHTRRAELGTAGRERAVRELDWRPQSQAYVSVFDGLFGLTRATTMHTEAGTAENQVG
jgi:glycosyltransferase involved in cell wall biosynthesis